MMTPAEAQEWRELGVIDQRGGPGPWRADGLCNQTDPDSFYPDENEPWRGRQAKRICRGCGEADACLTYALVTGETFGVWGGMSAKERRAVKVMPTPASYAGGAVEAPSHDPLRTRAPGRRPAFRAVEVIRLMSVPGAKTIEVAAEVGVHPETVRRIMRRQAQLRRGDGAA